MPYGPMDTVSLFFSFFSASAVERPQYMLGGPAKSSFGVSSLKCSVAANPLEVSIHNRLSYLHTGRSFTGEVGICFFVALQQSLV